MLNIGWSELLLIAVVAIIVVGPKELPAMLRTFGRTLGQLRRMSGEFRRQFDDVLREAEREADLSEARKSLESITRMDPLADVRRDFDQTMRKAASPTAPAVASITPLPAAGTPASAPATAAAAIAPQVGAGSDAA